MLLCIRTEVATLGKTWILNSRPRLTKYHHWGLSKFAYEFHFYWDFILTDGLFQKSPAALFGRRLNCFNRKGAGNSSQLYVLSAITYLSQLLHLILKFLLRNKCGSPCAHMPQIQNLPLERASSTACLANHLMYGSTCFPKKQSLVKTLFFFWCSQFTWGIPSYHSNGPIAQWEIVPRIAIESK